MNKRIFSKIVVFLFSFLMLVWIQNVNAEFKTTEKKSNSASFSWSAVENALIYKIDFGTSSTALDKSTDYIDSLTYTVFDLIPWTQYYFSLVWYDENANEIYKSEQITVTTPGSDASSPLSLEDAKMVWPNKVELSFSNDINDLSAEQREFRIENIKDTNDILEVTETEVSKTNKKNLVITLDKEPVIWTEYKIIVLSIRDIYNQNIEFWVDSEATFLWVEIDEIIPELNSAENEPTVEVSSEELKWPTWDLAWVDLNSAWVDPSVLTEATDASKLPQTWPESILVLLLAIIFSWIVFAYRFRKS